MSAENHHLGNESLLPSPLQFQYRIGVVVSSYYAEITEALKNACLEVLALNQIPTDNITVDYAPGAYELPLAARWMAEIKRLDAVIVLGCVIKGDTEHDRYINHAVANELQQLSSKMNIPFVFGVLTPNTHQQALDRAGGKLGNKGAECAMAALQMLALKERLQS